VVNFIPEQDFLKTSFTQFAVDPVSSIGIISIRGHPSKTSIKDDFEQIFRVSDNDNTPLPSTFVQIAKYVAYRSFFARYGPDVRRHGEGRGGLRNGRCWTGGGRGVTNSVVARTSLMNDPLFGYTSKSWPRWSRG